MTDLKELARLIREKNEVESAIAALVGRPALIGHVGEFIAAEVFGIKLHGAATKAGSDGYFKSGPLAGRSVNVKWYAKHEGILDIAVKSAPEFYLVLAGPKAAAASSRGGTRPWLIHYVFLFEAGSLHESLKTRGVKVGVATSVTAALWEAAEIYPTASNGLLRLGATERDALALFR